MQNNVIQGNEGILKGVNLAVDAIRPTYGNFGENASIDCDESPFIKIVNDAWTIIDAIKSNNRLEKQGLNLVKEGILRQNNLSGDGRKTTAIILAQLVNLGNTLDIPKIKLKKELDGLIPLVEAKIDEQKRLITVDDIEAVATISSESEEIGKLLGEIYKKIGKDGIIDPQPSGTHLTSYTITEGVRFKDTGFLSQEMVHDEQAVKEGRKETQAVYENPSIMVTKRKINNLNEINPILEMCQNNEIKDLVIFTDDMDSGVASSLINVHKNKIMNILIIKASVLWKQYVFEDFAKCVGATIVEDATGITFKNFPLSALGTCGKIIVDNKDTILKDIKDISEHLKALKDENTDDSKLRLSWLKTKSVDLLLGANGENDLYYKSMKCKDAINACKLALEDGVVEGGGKCLANISKDFMFGKKSEVEILLAQALLAPIKQLIANAGVENHDYQVDKDVMDAAMVLKNAVRSAIGLASTALTIGLQIPFLEKTEEELRLLTATKQMF